MQRFTSCLIFSFAILILLPQASYSLPFKARDESPGEMPVLRQEPSAITKQQTRLIKNMDEPTFFKLCESFLEKQGYTISIIVDKIGLLRAKRLVKSEMETTSAMFLVPIPTTNDVTERQMVVFTTTPKGDDLEIRLQLTREQFGTSYDLLVREEAMNDAKGYLNIFSQLQAYITQAR